jgi:dihydropteroate synthase
MRYRFKTGTVDFTTTHPVIMGILNTTPDSFSDGGAWNTIDTAVDHAAEMINTGAIIIDIGGESTRPGSEPVSLEEELDRTIPVIEAIVRRFDTLISIDTCKSRVARAACNAGAEIINDISGFTFDPEMVATASECNAACIIMHIKGTPRNMQQNPVYTDVTTEVNTFLKMRANVLESAGIERIILDPGFGFGKTLDHNYRLLADLDKTVSMGYPVLAGISRKSMIGALCSEPPDERVSGTIALNTIAVMKGASILRVHDVREQRQALNVIEKYLELS